jgi:hypothetical protein
MHQDDGAFAEVLILDDHLDDAVDAVVLPVVAVNVRNNFKSSKCKVLRLI